MKKKRKDERRRPNRVSSHSGDFEKLLQSPVVPDHYSFCLYVSGSSRHSARAISNIRSLCDEFLPGRYDLEVIDIHQQPVKTMNEQVIAVPTLIKKLPQPMKRMVGDLSDRPKMIFALGLEQPGGAGGEPIQL